MNKQEAIVAMQNGEKVTHSLFSPDEWITMDKKGWIYTEDGYQVKQELFWADRQGENWEDDWCLFDEDAYLQRIIGQKAEILRNLNAKFRRENKKHKTAENITKITERLLEMADLKEASAMPFYFKWDNEPIIFDAEGRCVAVLSTGTLNGAYSTRKIVANAWALIEHSKNTCNPQPETRNIQQS